MKQTLLTILFALSSLSLSAKTTFVEVTDANSPKNMPELWQTVDVNAEPTMAEVLYETEKDGVVVKVVRINVGTVNGKNLKVAGVYGYPKGAKNLPALLQIHGGGQYAHIEAVVANAKNGYTTFSMAWAGRLNCDKYSVKPDNLIPFWAGKTEDKKYMISTDWQDLEGYHAPYRWGKPAFSATPTEHTLDKVSSPRNSAWFLWITAGKRAITFLSEQKEVDASKIGVYGHSMGGHLTTLVSGSDSRVKAAVPSCGGVNSSYEKEKDLILKNTVEDESYLKNMSCPILFLSPANDFYGRIHHTNKATKLIQSKDWRIVSVPHMNHQATPNAEIATMLFFDEHLKNTFKFPQTPLLKLEHTKSGSKLSIKADNSREIQSVDVYYSTAGSGDRDYETARFWKFIETKKVNDSVYECQVPIYSVEKPLWVYANVHYKLDKKVNFAGLYYRVSNEDKFFVSSEMLMLEASQLAKINPKISDTKSNVILDGADENWKKDFYTYKDNSWGLMTNKLTDDAFKAPKNAKLHIEVQAKEAMSFVIVLSDDYYAEVPLKATNKVESFDLEPKDFKNFSGEALASFENLGVMQILPFYDAKAQVERGVKGAKGASKVIGNKANASLDKAPDFKLVKWN
ncbi:MAG: dienelactone hydrolase family protein [Opitutales bacterium]